MSERSRSEDVLESYLAHLDRHDVDGALEHLSDAFELAFAEGPRMDKEQFGAALGWDAGTNGGLEWEIVSRSPRELVVEGEESNDFLRLLGIPPLSFRSRFRFGPDGRIVEQHHETGSPGPSVDEALEAVVAWASEHAPEELERAYPEGRMIYSEESGRRWVALLRRWRGAVEG